MNQNIFETVEFDRLLAHAAVYAESPMGKEFLLNLQPLVEVRQIEENLTETTEMRGIIDFDDPFPIYGLLDIRPALKKAELHGNYLAVEEFSRILQNLQLFRQITRYFEDRDEKYPRLFRHASEITGFSVVEKRIQQCIDPDTNEVRDNASPNLSRIRRSIISAQQSIRKKMAGLLSSLSKHNYLQEDVITIRDGRLVLMVKDEYRRQVKGIIHDQSATGATLFVEPMETLEMNNQVRELMLQEKREIEKILIALTDLIRDNLDVIHDSLNAAAQLDFIHARGRLSAKLNAVQPQINDNNFLSIIQGRHPLLLLRFEDQRQVVPLDLTIGDSYNTLIITGPNAGGKTVALKTVGLLSLMIACGLHVPVHSDSELCIFKNIHAAIGDQQSIENDLSTFSSHIEKLKQIIDHVTPRDLTIIDEITSGTDPEEGAALAISLLERLTSIGCITMVSTHLGALKAFAHETDLVENGSMEFNAETLEPTYRFRLGMPGSSYAFEIANRYGISPDVIQRARTLVGKEKNKLENLLMDLDKRITSYQTKLEDVSDKQVELNRLRQEYEERSRHLKENEKQLKRKAIQESEDILKSANAAVELAIREIREQLASRDAIKGAKQLLETEQTELRAQKKHVHEKETLPKKEILDKKDIKIGQQVLWKSYNTKGKIISEVDSSDRVLMDTGGVKVRVHISELRLTEKKKSGKKHVHIKYSHSPDLHSELDLRGLRADDAEKLTYKFIEDAIVGGLEQVQIIHGKGTGALRKVVSALLDSHPHVKSNQLANWNQGGSGVTIVRLR